MWEASGCFARYGTLPLGGRLSYNSEMGVVEILTTFEASPQCDAETGINIDNSTIQEMFVQTIPGNQRLYVTLDRIPRFWGLERTKSPLQNNNG